MTKMNIAVFPHKRNFREIEALLQKIQTEQDEDGCVIFIGDDRESVRIAARMFGFTFVDTEYDDKDGSLTIIKQFQYSKKRSWIRCYAQKQRTAIIKILENNNIDVMYGEKEDEEIAATCKFCCLE